MSEVQNKGTTAQKYFTNAFSGNAAENYHKYFVPTIGAPLANDLVETAGIVAGERVLDVACGTGVVARLAAERVGAGGTVAGLDANPGMLAVARSIATPNFRIDWYESTAEKMPFSDGAFDVVLCQLGLQFFPDKLAALREMRRVLTPDGRLAIRVTGPTPDIFVVMDQALARHISQDAKAFVDAVFSLNDTRELEGLIKDAGFRDIAVQAETRNFRLPAPEEFLWQYIHGTPLIGLLSQVDDKKRAAFERDVVAKWKAFVQDGVFMLHVRGILASARS